MPPRSRRPLVHPDANPSQGRLSSSPAPLCRGTGYGVVGECIYTRALAVGASSLFYVSAVLFVLILIAVSLPVFLVPLPLSLHYQGTMVEKSSLGVEYCLLQLPSVVGIRTNPSLNLSIHLL